MKPLIIKGEVRKSKLHGWGVFATKNIRKGEIIEQCPFLITFIENHKKMNDYIFYRTPKTGIIMLGYGSVYNHTHDHNADHIEDTEKNLIEIIANRNIKKGEEISLDYGTEYFNHRRMKVKSHKPRITAKKTNRK